MGLNAVLKDRARKLSVDPTPAKVEGRTVRVPMAGSWFKARLGTDQAARVKDPSGTWRTVRRPTLTLGMRDLDGGALRDAEGNCILKAKDRVEVNSPDIGHRVWELTSDPAPIRKKHRVIGYTAYLAGVDFEPFTERIP